LGEERERKRWRDRKPPDRRVGTGLREVAPSPIPSTVLLLVKH